MVLNLENSDLRHLVSGEIKQLQYFQHLSALLAHSNTCIYLPQFLRNWYFCTYLITCALSPEVHLACMRKEGII